MTTTSHSSLRRASHCGIAPLLLVTACAQLPHADSGRPAVYADSWGQFFVDTYRNPRQVSVLRLGAGPARMAEYWVLELVDDERRLRPLHRTRLRNEWVPWSWRAAGDGRFFVTFDDRFEPHGTTAQCIVVYDLVRGVTSTRRADEFLEPRWLRSLSSRADWDGGPAYIDPLDHVIYTTSPEYARAGNNPFVVIDLCDPSVRVAPAPAQLPAAAYCETSDGHVWEWAFSDGRDGECPWMEPFRLPRFLRARRVDGANEAHRIGDELYFRLESPTDGYVRCDASEWRVASLGASLPNTDPASGER